MFRVAYVLLTVATILVCPFTCMAKVGAQDAPAEQRVGCSCCHHRQAPAAERPIEPERRGPVDPEGCNCTCLCKGAVETSEAPKVDPGEQTAPVAWLDSSLITQADTAFASLPSSAEGPPPSRFDSGRMLRLVLASLLL